MHGCEKDRYDSVAGVLLQRLFLKKLNLIEARRLIRDVCNIIRDGEHVFSESINGKLLCLGWKNQLVDRFSFELILYLIENKLDGDVILCH